MGPARRREVVEAARLAGLTVVEDDVYGALLPGAPPPLASLAPDLVFLVSSLSKVVSPALRTGFLTAPNGRHLGRVARALQAGALTTGSFNTALAARMIETGLAEEALRDMVAESVRRLGILRSVLGPDLALESAGTGFHVWIPMGREEAERVVSGALQESIALTPPSTVAVEGGEASGLRLCVGAVASDAELERALSTLKTLLV
jgi:DNA-binding transcriptional MocR family regulator